MKYFAALFAGAGSVLAFSPFGWWLILLPSIAILFFLWSRATATQAFAIGLCFGVGQFGTGVSWVYISIQTFGGMPPVLAAACVAVFVVLMALYPALAGFVQAFFRRWGFTARVVLFMPVIYTGFEWLRGWLFSGFPWLNAGYTVLDTPLSGLAPLGGVFLVGLATLFTIGAVMAVLRDFSFGSVLFALIAVALWGGSWFINQQPWTSQRGEPIKVAVIQNNVPLLNKWNEAARGAIVAEYLQVSQLHRNKDLVVWPEGAFPDYLDNIPEPFWDMLKRHPADFAFGALNKPGEDGRYYNSIAAVSGSNVTLYNKQHLVPFGEYFPLKTILAPVLKYLTIPMSNFSSWTADQAPLPLAGTAAAASICYEDAFPHEWRNQVAGAGILLNVSEDMWFGNSLGPHQRLQMAQFRSRESERPMVRSSNNGLSSLINWRGGIVSVAPQFVKAQVVGVVQPRTGMTPFARFGDLPALATGVLMLLIGLLFGRRRLR